MSTMKRILIVLLAIGFGLVYQQYNKLLGDAPMPEIPLDQWWGDQERPKDWDAYLKNSSDVIGNLLQYPEDMIEELRQDLNRTLRLAEPLEGVNFEYGFNTNYLEEIIRYWRDDYLPRWRAREVYLWQFNHFTTDIQGLRMHFLHLMVYDENKVGKHFYPVLLLHGWPGSVREFYKMIHMLHQTHLDKNNKYIFNIIVPSLPGFGWSQGTSKPGLGPAEIAVMMRNLMHRLGYNKYFVQGGDYGSIIGAHMATLFPKEVLGYHSNLCAVLSPRAMLKGIFASFMPSLFAPKGFEDIFSSQMNNFKEMVIESGYMHLQSTKSDTIGSALTDNPVGLAAYILEKFSTWTNPSFRHEPKGGLTKHYKLDTLLDNIMIYYFTNSITTSQRLYAEAFNKRQMGLGLDRVPTKVPTGCARFRHDLMHFLDFQLKDKFHNLIHSTYYQEGGHFIALERPKLLYADFIEFVKKVEKFSKLK